MSQSGSLNNGSTNSILEFTGGTGTSGAFPVSPNGFGQISLSSTDGSVAIVGSANSIDFSVNGMGSLTGNSGVATAVGDTVNVITANATVEFVGSGDTLTQDFGLTNLILGSSATSISSGTLNVGLGLSALNAVTTGAANVAIGHSSLILLTTSSSNTCVGRSTGAKITTSASTGGNTLIGDAAGSNMTSGSNVFIGRNCGLQSTTGSSNTCVGTSSFNNALTGQRNIVIGDSAAAGYTGSESSNIIIGNNGTAAESNVIRIGSQGVGSGQQNTCFIAGIAGVSNSNATLVTQNSSTNQMGVLATANSSFPATNSTGTLAMRALSVVIQTFVANGTYTPTAGMLYCVVEMCGPGGGGGGAAVCTAAQSAQAGAGGAGEYARGVFSAATIGANQSVTCPAGGAGGAAGANNGTAGANTTALGALLTAFGGAGGGGAAASAGGQTTAGGAGGTGGAGGSFRSPGQPGGNSTGSFAVFSMMGNGGSSPFGGGALGLVAGAAGTAAGGNGAGGGGALGFNSAARAGGNGSSAIIVITEYVIA